MRIKTFYPSKRGIYGKFQDNDETYLKAGRIATIQLSSTQKFGVIPGKDDSQQSPLSLRNESVSYNK